jgi:hypothetical protein
MAEKREQAAGKRTVDLEARQRGAGQSAAV